MTTFIAAGSNLNNRSQNLKTAAVRLEQAGYAVRAASPVYETPAALLYETAHDDWNRPYLNCVFKIETNADAFRLLADLKKIERSLGRDFSNRWAPRPVDLDIIAHNSETVDRPELHIPHKLYLERAFVLDPLSFFTPVPAQALYTPAHQPAVMGILNVTPDSFSDGGKNDNIENFEKTFALWRDNQIPFIDIGAESTRPDASPLTDEEELKRLENVFLFIKNEKKDLFSPRLSIDTYHWRTAEKALEIGFDIINDVHGADDKAMLDLAADNKDSPLVFTHHADLSALPLKETVAELSRWLENKLNAFEQKGLKRQNLIFDPGIGFGKTACRSLQILQNLKAFHRFGVRTAVGHSRKSFMNVFTENPASGRDTETLALSLKIAKDTDVLRVHTPMEHRLALTAAAHTENQFF